MRPRVGSAIVAVAVVLAVGAWDASAQALRLGQPAPELAEGKWINSSPLALAGLRGRVVLVDFWTFG